jgi:hypothetical protein
MRDPRARRCLPVAVSAAARPSSLGDVFALRISQKTVAGHVNRCRPFSWNAGLRA